MNQQEFLVYKEAIINAQAALKSRDFAAVKRWAAKAAQIAPHREEPWLLLAAVAPPAESISFLQKALKINPMSERATKGMQWALNRLGRTSLEEVPAVEPVIKKPEAAETQPIPVIRATGQGAFSTHVPAQPSGPNRPQERPGQTTAAARTPARVPARDGRSEQKRRRWLIILLALALIALVAFIIWAILPAWIAFARSSAAPIPGDMLQKPSLTPTATATATATPTATPTFTPTATFTATFTPTATYTPLPTDTPWPTDPPSTEVFEPVAVDTDNEGHWIDINLSEQTLYAYDGDEVVASFLVSTGTWLHPTVTGEYRIYVKYRYTDMRGDDYYLPDVPYTMYFYQGYGIHGTYWHDNFGTPMSHGCVNMRTSEAGWLFDFADVGTLVSVHY